MANVVLYMCIVYNNNMPFTNYMYTYSPVIIFGNVYASDNNNDNSYLLIKNFLQKKVGPGTRQTMEQLVIHTGGIAKRRVNI